VSQRLSSRFGADGPARCLSQQVRELHRVIVGVVGAEALQRPGHAARVRAFIRFEAVPGHRQQFLPPGLHRLNFGIIRLLGRGDMLHADVAAGTTALFGEAIPGEIARGHGEQFAEAAALEVSLAEMAQNEPDQQFLGNVVCLVLVVHVQADELP
jgi:hypothetical protein